MHHNTPGTSPPTTTTHIRNKEEGGVFFSPVPNNVSGQNSEGGHNAIRQKSSKPRSSKIRRVKNKQNLPVEKIAQPVSARETRHASRELKKRSVWKVYPT